MVLQPLAEVPVSPWIAALSKADLHLHQEERPRLDRVVARRLGPGLSQSRVCPKSVILSEAKNPVLASEGAFI